MCMRSRHARTFSTSCRDEFDLGRSPHTQTPLSCPRRRYRQEARGHRIKTDALDALQAALALSGRFECDADAAPPIVGVELDCSGALRSPAELRVAMSRLQHIWIRPRRLASGRARPLRASPSAGEAAPSVCGCQWELHWPCTRRPHPASPVPTPMLGGGGSPMLGGGIF